MSTFTFFYRTASPFSNSHACETSIRGVEFTSSEQMFMYFKAKLFKDDAIAAQILEASAPKTVKALGRKVSGFNGEVWDKYKFDLMCIACYHKFTQSSRLKSELLATAGTQLVEASPTDRIWGIGMDEKHPDIHNPSCWKGKNLLGKALDHVRNVIQDSSISVASLETLSLFESWFPPQIKKKIVWKLHTK